MVKLWFLLYKFYSQELAMVLSCVVYRYPLSVSGVVGLKVDSVSNTCIPRLLYRYKKGRCLKN
jgi:hypothetical protein